MNFEKPDFLTLLDRGRTVIFAKTLRDYAATATFVQKIMPITTIDALLEVDKDNVAQQIDAFGLPLRPSTGRVMLFNPHGFAHGFRVPTDRVVWIGERPIPQDEINWPIYIQAMSRGDMAWGVPAKLHYTVEEFFTA